MQILKGVARPSTQIALALALAFLVLLAALHVLEPEFTPSWRMISEYELGRYGWLMQLAFFVLAIANVALFAALRPQIPSTAGRVGLVLLLVGTAGIVLGGSFITDPITTAPSNWSASGKLHTLGGATFILLMPFFTSLISFSLVRHNPAWIRHRQRLFLSVTLVWLTIIAYFAVVAVTGHGGSAGPDVPMGWPNRAFMVAYCFWVTIVAWSASVRPGRSPE
jgi:hypothetical protein